MTKNIYFSECFSHQEIALARDKKYIIFGAGANGKNLVEYNDILAENVIAFCDNSVQLQGTKVKDIYDVVAPSELDRLVYQDDAWIIISIPFAHQEILNQLEAMNLTHRSIVVRFLEIFENDQDSLITQDYLDAVEVASEKYLLDKQNTQKQDKIKVVFVLHLLALISSFDSIYEEMKKMETFEPVFLISPTKMNLSHVSYDVRFTYDDNIIQFMKEKNYNFILGYENKKWINIYDLKPDLLLYNTTYQHSQMPSPFMGYRYHEKIKLAYISMGNSAPETTIKLESLTVSSLTFLNLCWKAFFDKGNYNYYQHTEIDKTLLVLSGSPKIDYYKNGLATHQVYFKNQNRIKILYTPSCESFEGRSSFLQYHKYFKNLLENNESIELAIRPHPFMERELIGLKKINRDELDIILSYFKNHPRCVYDTGFDYRQAFLEADFAVMDKSSINYEYYITAKPLIYTIQDINGTESFIAANYLLDSSYVVHTESALSDCINQLIGGKDPLKEKRVALHQAKIKDFFPSGTTNGKFIANYINSHIHD